MTPDEQGRYEFTIWCQYTRKGLHALQVGDLVAVENYTPPDSGKQVYSVLTLTQVYPTHFATQGPDAYPGHVFESMRSIKEEWEKQADKPLHHTTTIVAHAVSTGLQFTFDARAANLPQLDMERNLPMVGAEARPLSQAMVDAIINQGMSGNPDSPFTHKQFPDVNIKLDNEALLTTHFGVFGFTGVGKSNLLSSMITQLTSGTGGQPSIVIVDPNDEYLGLLLDRATARPSSFWYIHVGTGSLPQPIVQELGKPPNQVSQSAVQLARRQLNLPRAIKARAPAPYVEAALSQVLSRTRIVIPEKTMDSLVAQCVADQTPAQSGPAVKMALDNTVTTWTSTMAGQPVSIQNLTNAINLAGPGSAVRGVLQQAGLPNAQWGNATGVIDRAVRKLQQHLTSLQGVPSQAQMSVGDLVSLLNTPNSALIVVVTAKNVQDLKQFAAVLGEEIYEARRKQAILEPFTTMILDEADLFIPLDNAEDATRRIKEAAVTLARRGRKFGLGLGIATQRATLLDTEVMGNLHTYFVSKLPRKSDRERVAEAFGIGEEQLSPTFTFRPGNWLLISHDATGLRGVPIPAVAADANGRILRAAGVQP